MAKQKIGFLGTGIMGFQMARRLCEAGYPVSAWNRTRSKAEPLAKIGATIADTPAAATAGCDIAICMVSDGPTCDDVLITQGSFAAMPKGALAVVMSSIPVETAQAQAETAAEHGLGYLDAPVSGGEKGATDGTLSIMVGGDANAFEAARQALEVMGRPHHLGPVGSGQLSKLANQLIVANTLCTIAEALLLAQAGGADPAAVREALLGGFAQSTILRQHGARMIDGDYEPGGPAKYQVKDQRTATTLARKLGLVLPVSELAAKLFEDMVDHGQGDRDHSAIFLELQRRNGLSPE